MSLRARMRNVKLPSTWWRSIRGSWADSLRHRHKCGV